MVKYEVLLMLDPELPEERQEELVVRARELVERGGGTWVRHDIWGRRRLAYEIRHKGEGVYHLLQFDADPETLAELSRILRITDGVMRHMPTRRPQGAPRARAGAAVGTGSREEYAAASVPQASVSEPQRGEA